MPVATSYPGVYIEEIPSGVRTIHGRRHVDHRPFLRPHASRRCERGDCDHQLRGLRDAATADSRRIIRSPTRFRDFYQNVASTAVIVRLFDPG
jgi:hypothetical protein